MTIDRIRIPHRSEGVAALACCLLLAAAGCGGEPEDTPGRPLGAEGAHEHAVARIDIALEPDGGTIEFMAPAAGIHGFEHAPRNAEERQQQAAGARTLRERIGEMLVFDPALGCSITALAVDDEPASHAHDRPGYVPDPAHHDGTAAGDDPGHDHDQEHGHGHDHEQDHGHDHDHADGHSDVRATFRLACEQSPVGSRLRVDVARLFPSFDDVDLRVLTPARQLGRRVPAGGAIVTM